MGLAEGITVSFLFLSIFDLAYLAPSFALGIAIALGVVEIRTPTVFIVDPDAVSILLANFMVLVNVTNVLTTTFLAVARCMCVAKPLHFKNWFTRKRTIQIIVSFIAVAVISYTPVIANMGIVIRFDLKKNITRPTLWVSPKRESFKVITWMVIELVLPFATQFIVVVCVLIMINSLRASAEFRQSSTLMSWNVTSSLDQKINETLSSTKTMSTYKLAGKDVRVVQQVVLISLVYIICNTPKMIISVIAVTVPEFSMGKRFSNLYLSVNMLRQQFEMFNCSINTLIYYKYNAKFRTTLLSLFR
ncbi:hypothetical protein BsWGS_12768 [Bradybaena similaris]